MRKQLISGLSTLLIALLVPLVVFAGAYEINDVTVDVNGTNFATRIDATAHGHRGVTIRSEALVTEVHTCINPDGVRQDRTSYNLDYQAAVEQAMQIGPMASGLEILVFDDDQVTLPSQCPNDNWTRERRIVSIVQQISLLDTATREVLATTRCAVTIGGSTSGTFRCG